MKSPSSSTSSWFSPPAGSSSRRKVRLRHQRARDLDALLRPVGQSRGGLPCPVGEADDVERLERLALAGARVRARARRR